MALERKHIKDINNLANVLFHIYQDNDKHYEVVDINSHKVSGFVTQKISNLNENIAEINAHALLIVMNSDKQISLLNENVVNDAVLNGKFLVREFTPRHENTMELVSHLPNVKYNDLLYAKEILIKDYPYKVSLNRIENSLDLNYILDCGKGISFADDHKIPIKNTLQAIRNALAHGGYDYNENTKKISINKNGFHGEFSLYWLKGLSQLLKNTYFCDLANNKTFMIPTFDDFNNINNLMELKSHIFKGNVLQIKLLKDIDMHYLNAYDKIYYSAKKNDDRIKNNFETTIATLKSMGLKEGEYEIKYLPMAELFSEYSVNNFCARLSQVPNFFKLNEKLKGNAVQTLSVANKLFLQGQMPTKISTFVLVNLQEQIELLQPQYQNSFKKYQIDLLQKSKFQNLKNSQFPAITNPFAIKDFFNKKTEYKFDNTKIIPQITSPQVNAEMKVGAIMLQGFNSLVNTKFVDNICSLDDRGITHLYTSDDQDKLLKGLDFNGFKYATQKEFFPNDLLNKREGFQVQWKNPKEKKYDNPYVKRLILTKMRNAIVHGNVSVLYGAKEQNNEFLFVCDESLVKGNNSNGEYKKPATLIKAPVNRVFELFNSPEFEQVLKLNPVKTF